MEKKIVDKKYKMVSVARDGFGLGGSGLGLTQKRLYYKCACGKWVIASRWKSHVCKEVKNG
jgi:hypothetical protein